MRDADGDDGREGQDADRGQHGRQESAGAKSFTHGATRLSMVRGLLLDARNAMASPNRNARSAVVLGRLLGVAFLVCFATGVYSYLLQQPLPGMRFATRPAQLYQFTQGVHITAGIAIIPLLLAKLNAVMPALVQVPPVRGVLHLLERLSIAVLVASAIVQVVTGLLNTYQWYPWPFPFKQVHNALAYVIIGSLIVHVGVKLRLIARYWRKRDSYDEHGRFVVDPAAGSELLPPGVGQEARVASATEGAAEQAVAAEPRGLTGRLFRWIDGVPEAHAGGQDPASVTREAPDEPSAGEPQDGPTEPSGSSPHRHGRDADGASPRNRRRGPSPSPAATQGRRERLARRGFLAGVTAATAGVVVLTAGQSNKLAEPFNVFGARQRHRGPTGLPVNRTARAAGVLATATAADWDLTVVGPDVTRTFTRAELVALGTAEAHLPISCVEGWSQMAAWRGCGCAISSRRCRRLPGHTSG
ncbi:molybdopterin-binding protein [Curtobacterium flaccumfaciens]|nr:molybdopterin-binding protein [Curtobacterium flaccumfaciens]